jgi:hypothetical protein
MGRPLLALLVADAMDCLLAWANVGLRLEIAAAVTVFIMGVYSLNRPRRAK